MKWYLGSYKLFNHLNLADICKSHYKERIVGICSGSFSLYKFSFRSISSPDQKIIA